MILALYSLLTDDPSRSLWVSFVTDADYGTQNVVVHDGGGIVAEVSATPLAVPSATQYIYHAEVAGLTPSTAHTVEVPGIAGGTGHPAFRTLASRVGAQGQRIVVASDIHSGLTAAMGSPAGMVALRQEEPDALLIVGDAVSTFSEDYGTANAAEWVGFVSDYLGEFNANGMVPVILSPGNHEVGNHSWTGVGATNPDGTYYRIFFPNTASAAPAGKNYCAPTLWGTCQLICVDSHSAEAVETGAWVGGAINHNALVVIPSQHSPLCAADIRQSSDMGLQENLRNAVFAAYHSAPAARFGFAGHIHTRARSRPLTLVTDDPGADRFPLAGGADGYLVAAADGYRELGQGYRADRSGGGTQPWFLEDVGSGQKNYNVVDLTPAEVTVTTKGISGEVYWQQSWPVSWLRKVGAGGWQRSTRALPIRRIVAGQWQ